MAKYLCILALCIAVSNAVPNTFVAKPGLPANLDITKCLEELNEKLKHALQDADNASRDCVTESHDIVVRIHEDVWNSLQASLQVVKKQIEDLKECDDVKCKLEILKNIVSIAATNANENAEIVKAGLKEISAKFPEDYECIKDTFVVLGKQLKEYGLDFVKCIYN